MRDVFVCRWVWSFMAQDNGRSTVKAVETTLSVLESLHKWDGTTIETIADDVGVGTSTVHRHLVTLREHGYVVVEDGEYHLGTQFLTRGGQVQTRIPSHELIERKVHQLSEETGERVQFMVEEQGERVYVFTHAGPDAVRTDAASGKRGPLHASAAGKAILAYLPDDRREEILDKGIDPVTEHTITDRKDLKAELEEITDREYAFNDEESTVGLRAVGAPIRCETGHVIGAISITAPAHRIKGDYFREELPNLLLGTVNEIELNLKYS